MKVIANRSLCDGNGNCVQEAPEIFSLDEEDKVVLLQEHIGEDLRAKAEAAVRACPKSALKLAE